VSESEWFTFIAGMGADVTALSAQIQRKDYDNARRTLVTLLAALGSLAMQLDELD
jgi:hypothetical protein